jgi:hypothetical protein
VNADMPLQTEVDIGLAQSKLRGLLPVERHDPRSVIADLRPEAGHVVVVAPVTVVWTGDVLGEVGQTQAIPLDELVVRWLDQDWGEADLVEDRPEAIPIVGLVGPRLG